MFEIRLATPADAETIAQQRGQMFVDMGSMSPEAAAAEQPVWANWLRGAVAKGNYVGFVAECGAEIAGGAGMMLLPRIPTTTDLSLYKAHILNVSVAPEYRRQGVAEALMRALLDEVRQRGLRNVSLNAAPMGRKIYERLGFVEASSPEMRLTLEPA